eukprot:scaffold7346_cov245-Pinguiococcus_pyrenoidosus.AAC.36
MECASRRRTGSPVAADVRDVEPMRKRTCSVLRNLFLIALISPVVQTDCGRSRGPGSARARRFRSICRRFPHISRCAAAPRAALCQLGSQFCTQKRRAC